MSDIQSMISIAAITGLAISIAYTAYHIYRSSVSNKKSDKAANHSEDENQKKRKILVFAINRMLKRNLSEQEIYEQARKHGYSDAEVKAVLASLRKDH